MGTVQRFAAREPAVRCGGAQPGHVRRAQGGRRDQPARRAGPRHSDQPAGTGPVYRRSGATLRTLRAWWMAMPRKTPRLCSFPHAQLRALIIADAELGERIVRGVDPAPRGAHRIGPAAVLCSSASRTSPEVLRVQNFCAAATHPYHLADAAETVDAAQVLQSVARGCRRRARGVPRRHGAAQSVRRHARLAGSASSTGPSTMSSSMSPWSVPARRASPPRYMRRPKA